MNDAIVTVLVAGGTGLVGRACLETLAAARGRARVIALVRDPARAALPEGIEPLAVDFASLERREPIACDLALCALGTTLKAAGSEAAFRRVDYDAVVAFAALARLSGARGFGLVSSVGADARSRNLYLRTKGEAEERAAALGFEGFVALRPSLLLGARAESRPAEALAQRLAPGLGALLFGGARRYRAIEAGVVGRALASLALVARPDGREVWHYDELTARG